MAGMYERLIGKQVAKIRKERGMSQAQLAEAIDVAPETISRLERGVSIPSLNTLENISQALDISLKDLFNFEYAPKVKISPSEKELAKIVVLLKTRKAEEIRLAHKILNNLFKGINRLR